MDWRTGRRWAERVRTSEGWLIGLAAAIGAGAGLLAVFQGLVAHLLQNTLYDLPISGRLSMVSALRPAQLLILPLGGLTLGLVTLLIRRFWPKPPIDVVEANALYGGRLSVRDAANISTQTILSNGVGASVGLEAAYAQMGGTLGSLAGQRANLRRGDIRILVGAGAGAAIGAAFGAPLTGSFYAFEVVLGAYTPSAIAPVAAACLAAALVGRTLGAEPYLIAGNLNQVILTPDYLLYAVLGALCALFGIGLMRLVSLVEISTRRLAVPDWLRPALGGLLLIPIVWASPQALSAGHGALRLDLIGSAGIGVLLLLLFVKTCASTISLGFNFRGGLFFASLFMGSLLGQIYVLVLAALGIDLPRLDGALVGMAALGVAVVGGPMTMSFLILEATHDFALTSAVIAATLISSAVVRERFGYSFSTWRMHLRGETIRSARDVGWVRTLTASSLMRDVPRTPADASVAEFKERFPLGSTQRVAVVDAAGHYCGIITPSTVYAANLAADASVASLAIQEQQMLPPEADIAQVMRRFDETQADELAVVGPDRQLLGIVSEKFVRKRYAEELDKMQRALFGEQGQA
ncbi:chloride channel protein [Pedomonas mirosovicensis]|uniref:chloride channel protein n=1 Tax=Pedomonas mirosovicensis TaxID=2908641 RepID=UPI002166C3E2|nr:chloride channel protein [Pedomonas mirosovicensis]MCH8684606.1 chloride channel protein [Pedomonas mirosovicensis]